LENNPETESCVTDPDLLSSGLKAAKLAQKSNSAKKSTWMSSRKTEESSERPRKSWVGGRAMRIAAAEGGRRAADNNNREELENSWIFLGDESLFGECFSK
jgi:hypothetical protein